MTNVRVTVTPLPVGYISIPNADPYNADICYQFQQVIGLLLYIMLGTCPDIAYTVMKLSQYATNPSKDHLVKVYYICHYLAGTPDYVLVYKDRTGIISYTDSDWASDLVNCQSTTGYIVKMASVVFSWNSRVQKTIVLSFIEAENMLLSDVSRQLIWVSTLLSELGLNPTPIPLYGDNQGAIFMASNPVQECRIKHIDIHYHFIR
jgi:hypothetical protein